MRDIQSMLNVSSFFSNASMMSQKMPTVQDLTRFKSTQLSPEKLSALSAGNADARRSLTAGIFKNLETNAKFGLLTDIRSTLGAVGERLNLLALKVGDLNPAEFRAVSESEPITGTEINTTFIPGSKTVARSSSSLPLTTDTNIDPNAKLKNLNIGTAITSGTFTINGTAISINRDTDTLQQVIDRINLAGAGVAAALVSANKQLQIVGPADVIQFGDSVNPTAGETSNFLTAMKVNTAELLGTQVPGAKAAILGAAVSLSADPGKNTALLGGQKIGFSSDPGVSTELTGDNVAKNAFKAGKVYNINDITSITTSTGSFTVDLAPMDTTLDPDAATATFNVLNSVVDEINAAAGNTGLVSAELVSVGTNYQVRIMDLNNPYGNVSILTQAGDDAGTAAAFGFTKGTTYDADSGTPTTTTTNSITGASPSTDYGTLQLTGTGTSTIAFKNGTATPTNAYLSTFTSLADGKVGASAFVRDKINAATGTTGITASVDPEGRILLSRATAGALNLQVNAVTTDNDTSTVNNASLGFSATTVNNGTNAKTDYGTININGQSINFGVQDTSFLSTYTSGADTGAAAYLKDQINLVSANSKVTASVSAGKVQLTQQTAGVANGINVAVVITDSNGYAADNSSPGFAAQQVFGTNTVATSTADLGVSDFDKTFAALAPKLGLLVPTAPNPGRFQINGTNIDFFATDKLQDVINRINGSAANVDASYDIPSNKLILTSRAEGPAEIDVNDVIGNFLEVFRIPQTINAQSATSAAGLNLNVSDAEIKINPNDKLNTLNTLTPIGSTTGSFNIAGTGTATINFDPTADTLNSLVGKINLETATTGVTASYDAGADQLELSSATGNFQINTPTGNGANLLTQLNLPTGVNGTGTTIPGIKAVLTGSVNIALNGQADIAARGVGSLAIGKSTDPGQIPILNGTNLSIGQNVTRDFGSIDVNGTSVAIGNLTGSNDAAAVDRSLNIANQIIAKFTNAGVPVVAGITATTEYDATNARYFVRLTGSAASNNKVEITNQLYTDPGVKNQSTGFFKGNIAIGRAPSTDFGTITLNGTPVNLGVIGNTSPESADPSQYIVDTINDFTAYTNVVASKGTVGAEAGKIVLTSVLPGSGANRDIVISAVNNDTDGIASNNIDGAGSAIGFVAQTLAGTDGKTDFGTLTVTGATGTSAITLGTLLNRENTASSALSNLVTKINAQTGTTGVEAAGENGKLVLRSIGASNQTITVNSFANNSDGNAANDKAVGFVGVLIDPSETDTGTNPQTVYDLTSTSKIGQSDLDLKINRIAGKIGLTTEPGNLLRFEINGSEFTFDTTNTTLRTLLDKVSNDAIYVPGISGGISGGNASAGVAAAFNVIDKKISIGNDSISPTLTYSDLPGGSNFTGVSSPGGAKLVTLGGTIIVPGPQEVGTNSQTLVSESTFTTDGGSAGGEAIGSVKGTVGALLLGNLGAQAGGLNLKTPITNGTFSINGKAIEIDTERDDVNTLLKKINASGAGVTARIVGNKLQLSSNGEIELGSATDTSNFFEALQLKGSASAGTTASLAGGVVKLNESGDETDFGSVDINGVNISLGTVSNSLGAQGAAQEIANKLNELTSETGVVASVDKFNRLQLEQTAVGAGIEVRNTTQTSLNGLFAATSANGSQATLSSGEDIVPGDFKQEDVPPGLKDVVGEIKRFIGELNTAQGLLKQDNSSNTGEISQALKKLKLDELGISVNPKGRVEMDEERLVNTLRSSPGEASQTLRDAQSALAEPGKMISSMMKRMPNLMPGAMEFARNSAAMMDMQVSSEQAKMQMDKLMQAQQSMLEQTRQMRDQLGMGEPQNKKALNVNQAFGRMASSDNNSVLSKPGPMDGAGVMKGAARPKGAEDEGVLKVRLSR